MYIYKIKIENFRNFEHFEWKPNRRVNVLFGHNGCGKTNLAEAISLVFSTNRFENYFDKSDFFNGNDQKKIQIQIWFDDINDIEIHLSEVLQHIDDKDNFIVDDQTTNSKAVVIYQLESGQEGKMEWSFFNNIQPCASKFSDRDAISYIHIGADRQPLKEVGMQTKSTFYKLAKDSIAHELERISNEIISLADNKINESSILNDYLKELQIISNVDIIENYSLMMKNPASTWNSSGYELGTSVGNTKLSFSRQSQGIQNLFLLLLMKKRLEGSGIVFVEELEQNLEPKMQRYIADEYKKLGIGQLFITSHSPEIISHFEYSDISILHKETAIALLSGLDDLTVKKEIFRVNKKEFISALMAEKILLVEGESEYESFPIYSYQDNSSLSQNDVEMIKIGGKAKVDIYCKTFKHFGKKVYVLLDNDTDITATLNKVKDNADVVYLAMNSYEDLIFPYADKFLNKLSELLDFTVVKNKLVGIYNTISTDSKKTAVKNSMEADSIDPNLYMSYTDLASSKSVLEYVLHDSFATSYCARAVANFICEEKIVPMAYLNLIQHLSGKSQELNLHAGYSNVYELNG